MFDTEKIRRMAEIFQKLPADFDDIYLIPEVFTQEAVALFKRLNIKIRKIIFDAPAQKEVWGIPVVKTADVAETFNERTALIILVKQPVKFIQTTFNFKRRGIAEIPAFVISSEEIAPIYDRLTILKILQQYREDGLFSAPPPVLAERFARGLTTILDSKFQNFKYQLWDSREYFKPIYTFDDTAIVFQGPIAYENNYTVETFKLYRSIYPNAPIVVSTWKNEATDAFRKECQNNSIVLLENEMPAVKGFFNVNLQIESSHRGVEYVRENTSAKFVLKTRTDQRINRFDFLVYFKNLLETFPPKGDKLHERIIFLNSNISRSWSFFFTDYLSFGNVEDILRLYDIPFCRNGNKMDYTLRHIKRHMALKGILFRHPIDYKSIAEQSHKLYKFNKMMNRY